MLILFFILIVILVYVCKQLNNACENYRRELSKYKKCCRDWANRYEFLVNEKLKLEQDLKRLQELRDIDASRH